MWGYGAMHNGTKRGTRDLRGCDNWAKNGAPYILIFTAILSLIEHVKTLNGRCLLKGTVSRDFLTLVFFIKQLLLVPLDKARQDFEFFRIFEELFEFVIDSPVYSLPGSRDSLVYSSPGSRDSPEYSSLGS